MEGGDGGAVNHISEPFYIFCYVILSLRYRLGDERVDGAQRMPNRAEHIERNNSHTHTHTQYTRLKRCWQRCPLMEHNVHDDDHRSFVRTFADHCLSATEKKLERAARGGWRAFLLCYY